MEPLIVNEGEHSIFRYTGRKTQWVYSHPTQREQFETYDELLEFIEGEIQTLQALKTQFEEWLENAP